ncbi:His Kinase A domain containing protein [Pleurotus ostreatus]|uniref:histidine kinase n=1 Tax=Pleurotus ostreatus TaxID=5322 RepID=A0A8H6ZPZ8_PLEOS|nr:His Kinase A domain containing protein [Pleurotus ostreatus]KAF7424282.1 His Kinase A domain containing protein [Pleurotus ostreatus]
MPVLALSSYLHPMDICITIIDITAPPTYTSTITAQYNQSLYLGYYYLNMTSYLVPSGNRNPVICLVRIPFGVTPPPHLVHTTSTLRDLTFGLDWTGSVLTPVCLFLADFACVRLMVIDDAPREEFSPRQRHTLKEFAAIAMREMELWRDKIQLRIRDKIQNSMEQFSRECLEIDSEAQAVSPDQPHSIVGASMDKVYSRAAKLVKKTLDVEGVIVVDVSHCEVLESLNSEGSVSVVLHHGEPVVNVAAAGGETTARQLTPEEYSRLVDYFAKHPDGKISEGIVPPAFRPFLPTRIQYALIVTDGVHLSERVAVPIFNVDKRPFALLCAYNASEHTKRFLEGHELSYLRAIGVIILSAVLKRRMALADKAKSLFISNISHELRTPLHGILAAAELLADTPLNHSQASFLQTVQACGTSLVETVNHVLDFTKLSGNSKSGGVEKVIVPTKVDLMQLVEEAVDGCWVGYRARTQIMRDSAIGSVYSPPEKDAGNGQSSKRNLVETVVDIGHREGGWLLKCERGGIRRVLMNLFGNSLKFTSNGFIHVILRQLPSSKDDPPNRVKIELGVCDTGKGISQSFLKNQLFHPFSQENPLQTGTGLGLAIVNSIVHSDSVNGTVDVWSEEGLGTELKVTFSADVLPTDEGGYLPSSTDMFRFDDPNNPPTVALVGFDTSHPGVQLLFTVTRNYLVSWWGFNAIQTEDPGLGDIVIINNDPSAIVAATERRDTARPFLIFSALRGSPALMAIASDHENIGGFCRIVYKPGGPSRLRTILNLAMHALKIVTRSQSISPSGDPNTEGSRVIGSPIPRRNSEEISTIRGSRPFFPRSSTAHPGVTSWKALVSPIEADESPEPEIVGPTIPIGNGGTLLKSSVGTIDVAVRRFRVLVVEDNSILRTLLVRWLKTKGYDYRDAVDGRDGVNIYQAEGPFDVVLLDLSMPVLDGIGATSEIRQIEAAREQSDNKPARACILALTGMSSLEDKRRAFEAGVDGYLVKPVAFKTLEDMFHKLGIT